jgi:hypothetical protein
MLVIDQGKQCKNIVAVTILDYNLNTIFGLDVNNKKLWLGKYDTPSHALIVCKDVNRAINDGVLSYTMP